MRLGSHPRQAAPRWRDPTAALAGIPNRVLAISMPLGVAVYGPHCWPFFVCCISGSRAVAAFLVELGAAIIVASAIMPAGIDAEISVSPI